MPCDVVVQEFVSFVDDHVEQVESGHDGGADVEVVLQGSASVVSPFDWVGGCEDGCSKGQETYLAFRVAWMPALAMEMVCCSIAS